MRLFIVSMLLIGSTGYAMEWTADAAFSRRRTELNQIMDEIFTPRAGAETYANVGTLTGPNGRVQWGHMGGRYFIGEMEVEGRIIDGGVIDQTPYFYFFIESVEGRRETFLYSMGGELIKVQGLPATDFEIYEAGPLADEPGVIWLEISDGNNAKIFRCANGNAEPLLVVRVPGQQVVKEASREERRLPPEARMPARGEIVKKEKTKSGCFRTRRK